MENFIVSTVPKLCREKEIISCSNIVWNSISHSSITDKKTRFEAFLPGKMLVQLAKNFREAKTETFYFGYNVMAS